MLFRPHSLNAMLIAAVVTTAAADSLDLDFLDGIGSWNVVVDGVIGGRMSTGEVARFEPGVLRFSGDLSLENDGGFSQIRRPVSGDQLAGTDGIELTVRGDGRTYSFDVRAANARVMAGGFQQSFDTTRGEWMTIRLPFDAFRLYSFGRPVANPPALVPALIESIGVTLSDKIEGPFRLDLGSIRAYEAGPSAAALAGLESVSPRLTLRRLEALAAAPRASAGTSPRMVNDEARRLIELSITRGVPLFNGGQEAACAALYEVTIEAILGLGADRLDPRVAQRLRQGLRAATDHASAADRAWTYRRALDDALSALATHAMR